MSSRDPKTGSVGRRNGGGTRRASFNAMDAANRMQVLLVDDEARSVRLLARMLREDGYDVEVVHDGAAAIGRLTRDPLPDALVTDVRMPTVDGVAVARYARARRPSMIVVFLTSYPELLSDAAFEPAALVHSKPVEYAVLRGQLGRMGAP